MASSFEEAVSSLGSSDSVRLVDGWTHPRAAESALEAPSSGKTLVLKLFARGEASENADFAPAPKNPVLAKVERGSAELVIASGNRSVSKISVTSEDRAWGLHTTPFHKIASEILLHLDSDTVLSFAGTLDHDREGATTALAPLARALAGFFGIPLEGVSEGEDDQPSNAAPNDEPGLLGANRLALSFEGEHLVLRDYQGRGPRENAARYRTIALFCFVPSLVSWGFFAWFLKAYLTNSQTGIGFVLAPLAVGLVLGVAAFAFFEIGRYAAAYSADSSALAWFGDDRVVVAPWVDRHGGVDIRPEGRLGAAIRTAEVSETTVSHRDDRYAVVLETAHGPIEIFDTPEQTVADHFAGLVDSAVRAVASPQKKRTALMRAHSRREAPAQESNS